jgi:nitrous oxidase accessory protein NosD
MRIVALLVLMLVLLCSCCTTRTASRSHSAEINIQDLISNAADERVCIPRGTYVLSKGLEVNRSDITIWCEPGTRILISDVNENVVSIHNVKNVRIENAHLSHLKPLTEYNCHGNVVDIRDAEDVTIFNCDLNGCGATGVYADSSKNLSIQNCWIHRNTFNAFYLNNCEQVLILANLIENNANLFQIYESTDIEASDNLIRNNGGYWRPKDSHSGMRTK